jgi:hypothetical protein
MTSPSAKGEKNRMIKASIWIQEIIVFTLVFLYLLLRVHPLLLLESQSPVFLLDATFFNGLMEMPGGITDWITLFFLQLWFADFLSALFLTMSLWLVAFLTRMWIGSLSGNRMLHTVHLIPALLLLVLHSQYDFRLNITVALVINLVCVILYMKFSPRNRFVDLAAGLAAAVLLYWITGGAFLIFTILAGMYQILFQRKFIGGFILILVSTVLPLAAFMAVYLITFKQAYLHNLVFEFKVKSGFVGYFLYSFFILALLITALAKHSADRKVPNKGTGRFGRVKPHYFWRQGIGTVLLIVGIYPLLDKSSNNLIRIVLQTNRLVRENRWQDVLKLIRPYAYINPLISFQTNLSLFKTGHLLDSMFVYPQDAGTTGLIMDYKWFQAWPEEASNLYWEMGLVSESQHWAHEAIEHKGYTPYLLKRLGMVYMVKGNHNAARRFLLNLKNVPFYGITAEELLQINENPPAMAGYAELHSMLSDMPAEDYISLGKPSIAQMEVLLKRNPRNRMAFEYLIAYHLLQGNTNIFKNSDYILNVFADFEIPRHVQEALIFYILSTPESDLNLLKKWISPAVSKKFTEYRQMVMTNRNDQESTRRLVQTKFADTYWYYLMFVRPAIRQTEN